MNTLLLTPNDVREDRDGALRACIADDRAAHLITNLDVSPGTRLRVGVLEDRLGWGEVLHRTSSSVEISFRVGEAPPPKLPLTLVVGLPRPKAARRLLVDAAAVGAARIALLGSWRVAKSYWQSPLLAPEAIDRCVTQGLALAGDCIRPEISVHPVFKPFVEDELPGLLRGSAWLADPDAPERCERRAPGPVLLCVGPERGFTAYERDRLVEGGLSPRLPGSAHPAGPERRSRRGRAPVLKVPSPSLGLGPGRVP